MRIRDGLGFLRCRASIIHVQHRFLPAECLSEIFETQSDNCEDDWIARKFRSKLLEHTFLWIGSIVFMKSPEKRKLLAHEENHLEKLATQAGHVIGIADKQVLANQESLWNPMSRQSYQFSSGWRDSSCVEWSWTCHLVQDSVA